MSSSKIRKCCVPHCEDKTSRRHRFPTKKELVNIWINRINNPKFAELTRRQIELSRFVCESHFAPMNVDKRRKCLLKGSLPTINIPGFNEEPTKNNCFYFSTLKESAKVSVAPEPKLFPTSHSQQHLQSDFMEGVAPLEEENIEPLPDTSKRIIIPPAIDVSSHFTANVKRYSGESTVDTCFAFPVDSHSKEFLLDMPVKVREMLSKMQPSLTTHLNEEENLEVTKPKTTYCVPSQRKQKEWLLLENSEGAPLNHNIVNDHLYAKRHVTETVPLNNIIMNTTEDLGKINCIDTEIDVALTDKSLNNICKDTEFPHCYDIAMDFKCSDSIPENTFQLENNEGSSSNIILENHRKPTLDDHEYCKSSATDSVKTIKKSPQTKSDTVTAYAIIRRIKKKTKKTDTVVEPFFSNILQRSMFEADIHEESMYDFQNDELMPSSSLLAETPIFPELESTASSAVTVPQYKSYIKAVIIVRGDKIVNLVSLKQPLKMPKSNPIIELKRENNATIKEKIKKLVAKISGNRISKVDRSETLKTFLDIQGILNSNSNVFEIEISPEGKEKSEIALKELLSKISKLMPKDRKKTRIKQEDEQQQQDAITENVETVKKPRKRGYPHCRLCLEVIFGEFFWLSGTSPKGHPIKDMVAMCLPEINPASSNKPVICPSCIFNLSISYEFKMKCLQSEEKINEYRTMYHINDDKTVYLKKVINKFNNNTKETEVSIGIGEASNSQINSSEKENQMNIGHENVPSIHEEEEEEGEEEIQPNNPDMDEEHTKQNDENLIKFTFDVSKVNFDAAPKEYFPKRHYLNKNEIQKTYKCHVCYRKFILERRLKLHYYKDHDISKLYMCKLCGKYFKDAFVLRQHINRIHCVLLNVKKTSSSDFDF